MSDGIRMFLALCLVVGAVFGEKTGTTTAKVSWDIQDNTIITTNTKRAAIYFEYVDSGLDFCSEIP